jgi:hypothetical protein
MRRIFKIAAKFVIAMIALSFVFAMVWQGLVANRLYDCTDAFGFDYLQPGNWVHHPIPAKVIVANRSMSEPDTIKEGWSMKRLWILWGTSVVISLAIGVRLTWMRWIPFGWVGAKA